MTSVEEIEFVQKTGAPEETAKHYLEMAEQNLDHAVMIYEQCVQSKQEAEDLAQAIAQSEQDAEKVDAKDFAQAIAQSEKEAEKVEAAEENARLREEIAWLREENTRLLEENTRFHKARYLNMKEDARLHHEVNVLNEKLRRAEANDTQDTKDTKVYSQVHQEARDAALDKTKAGLTTNGIACHLGMTCGQLKSTLNRFCKFKLDLKGLLLELIHIKADPKIFKALMSILKEPTKGREEIKLFESTVYDENVEVMRANIESNEFHFVNFYPELLKNFKVKMLFLRASKPCNFETSTTEGLTAWFKA